MTADCTLRLPAAAADDDALWPPNVAAAARADASSTV